MTPFPSRIVHHDPACPVCATTTPTLVVQAGPLPKPYLNPNYTKGRYRGPADEVRDGGPYGHHWYHGTSYDPHEDADDWDDDETKKIRDFGGDLHAPESSGSEYGERANKHWNTDLGVHFSSHHFVARDEFAAQRGVSPTSRVAHASLHMRNPIHFDDEHEFAHHAATWAHGAGHRYLPENEQAHKSFVDEDYEAVGDHDAEEGKHRDYEYHRHLPLYARDRKRISEIDQDGPEHHDQAAQERWLGMHPDREDIASGYRDHLRVMGHDGIVYGNTYEGPHGHPCAIAFPTTPVHIKKWEWLDEDHPSNQPAPRKPRKRKKRPKSEDPDQLKLFGARSGDSLSFQPPRGEIWAESEPGIEHNPRKWAYRQGQWDKLDKAKIEKTKTVGDYKLHAEKPDEDSYGLLHATHKDGQYVGEAFYGDDPLRPGHIDMLPEVHPDHRGKGIGSAMVDLAEELTGKGKINPTVTLRGMHPQHGEVGSLRYRVPKHKGDNLEVEFLHVRHEHQGNGYAGQLMDEMQARHPDTPIDHGARTLDGQRWWKSYTKDKEVTHGRTAAVEKLVHRGIAVGLKPEDHDFVHDNSRSKAERAHHLLDAVSDEGSEPLGQHWAQDETWAHHFATQYATGYGIPAGRTHVVFHATHPEPDEIIHDPGWREEHEVNDDETEVPIHRGTDMEVKGVSWRKSTQDPWHHHILDEPQWHTARRTAAVDEPDGPWHIANAENRESIKRHGLIASESDEEDRPTGVYVFHHMPLKEAVENFAVQYGWQGAHHDVWHVHGAGEPQHDIAWQGEAGYYPHDIPPHQIRLAHTFQVDHAKPEHTAARRIIAADWQFEHRQIEGGPSWRTFGGPADAPRQHMLDYRVPQPGKVDFGANSMGGLDYLNRKHGPEAVDRMTRAVLDHHSAVPFVPKPKVERRVYYHGTTVPDVTHILPATQHGGGTMFPMETSPEHAYATLDKDVAWGYAEKASDRQRGMRPRVYQVRPIGGHQHVEDDPQYDAGGNHRGAGVGSVRSKRGFEVVREMKMPKSVGHPDDWDDEGNSVDEERWR